MVWTKDKSRPIIRMLEKELNDGMEKLWRIFSWTSTVFISLIGGVIALANINEKFSLGTESRVTISVVIVLLTSYCWLWIRGKPPKFIANTLL